MSVNIPFIPILLGFCLVMTSQGREFTSADGKQTMEAEFIRYSKRDNQVTLRLSNGRNLVTEASHFSEKDQAFFIEEGKKAAMDDSIRVETDKDSDSVSKDRGNMRIRYKTVKYSFELENRSPYNLEKMEIKYWVVVERGGNSKPEIYKGSKNLSQLAAKEEAVIDGPEVTLTINARSTCDCPKVAEAAAKIGRDDILGERIEVRNSEGRLIYSDSSSKKVDKALGLD